MRTLSALRLSVLIEQLHENNEFLEVMARFFESMSKPRTLPAANCRAQIARNNEAMRKCDSSVVTLRQGKQHHEHK